MKSSSWIDNYIQMFEGVFILFFHFCSITTFWSCHFSKFRNISCFSFIVIVIVYIWKKFSQAKNIWWPDNRSSLYYICFISVLEKNSLLLYYYVYYVFITENFWLPFDANKIYFKFTMCSIRLNIERRFFSFYKYDIHIMIIKETFLSNRDYDHPIFILFKKTCLLSNHYMPFWVV